MSESSKIDAVVKLLRDQIKQGKYAAGQRLPSERELGERFGVSRPTIRAALLRLQADNLIEIVPRGGIFVRSHTPKVILGGTSLHLPVNKGPELQRVGSFIHAMRSQGREVLIRYLQPSAIIPAGKEIGQQLQVSPDVEVLHRYRVQVVDRVPYRIIDSYYLASLTGELVGQEDHEYPLFKWLRENKGVRPIRAHERLTCRMPSSEEASILNIARNQPVVEMDRWLWASPIQDDSDEEILFEYSRIISNASLHQFAYTYDIDEEASQ